MVSAVAEMLAPFRGTGDLHPAMLIRSGRELALAELELAGDARVIDLDDPAVLVAESLRPSTVATGRRAVTQGLCGRPVRAPPRRSGIAVVVDAGGELD